MDPYLRVVNQLDISTIKSEYNGSDPILTLEDTIDLTQQGYFMDQDNSVITQEEINDLASYPININRNDWDKYREMTLEQLLEEFPELKYIPTTINYEDAYFYATRGILKIVPHHTDFTDRWKKYRDLSILGKQMINNLYSLNFVNTEENAVIYSNISDIHVLEPYIIEFDKFMGNQDIIIAIGRRIGFDIHSGYPGLFKVGRTWINENVPYEEFIDKFNDVIKSELNPIEIKTIVQIRENEFNAKYNLLPNIFTKDEIDQLYSDRLYLSAIGQLNMDKK